MVKKVYQSYAINLLLQNFFELQRLYNRIALFLKENYLRIYDELKAFNAMLVAVSKTKPISDILDAYKGGQKIFGENYVQELAEKQPQLPPDIEWHFIGHLQSNKVKLIAPFVKLVHGVDSFSLLKEINKQAVKHNRIIDCLLQIHIAQEETKFGLSFEEAENILNNNELKELKNINLTGLMGMASLTANERQVVKEFQSLSDFFSKLQTSNLPDRQAGFKLQTLSMGMTSDYKIALKHGSNMVRIGSAVFGERN